MIITTDTNTLLLVFGGISFLILFALLLTPALLYEISKNVKEVMKLVEKIEDRTKRN